MIDVLLPAKIADCVEVDGEKGTILCEFVRRTTLFSNQITEETILFFAVILRLAFSLIMTI